MGQVLPQWGGWETGWSLRAFEELQYEVGLVDEQGSACQSCCDLCFQKCRTVEKSNDISETHPHPLQLQRAASAPNRI